MQAETKPNHIFSIERERERESFEEFWIVQSNLSAMKFKKKGSSLAFIMGLKGSAETVQTVVNSSNQTRTVSLHVFSNLSHITPAIFVYLLIECYKCGRNKATAKFRALQQQLQKILQNSPQPGPATFVAQCLYIFAILGPPYAEGFSHLLLSGLRRVPTYQTFQEDFNAAQGLATQFFLDATVGLVIIEVHVLIKVLESFDVRLLNVAKAINISKKVNDDSFDLAKAHLESYIYGLIERKAYEHAVIILERFSFNLFDQSFLLRMMQEHHFKPAEKWATFMGRPMLCVMVKTYMEMKLLKNAYELIKKNNLRQEFPEAYHMCKESSLKKLAEKGCWDVAEMKAHGDKQLLEYVVYLAMEAGYSEKVNELCERYSLTGFLKIKELEANPSIPLETRYLNLNELAYDGIIWVDEVEGLDSATSHIEKCKVVGVDCEWKPNYIKGSKPNKVSIIQIACEKVVYIMDLIKLSVDEPDVLNRCLKRILQSPSILKLGYNLQCDLKQLSHSYTDLECFKHYEMLLDIQNVFKEPNGGLSGLVKKILGAGLNKTRRNSNWEKRPLSQNQMEYAALDAAVLVQIFRHVGNQTQLVGADNQQAKIEWRSNIVSHMDSDKKRRTKPKKKTQSKKTDGEEGSTSE